MLRKKKYILPTFFGCVLLSVKPYNNNNRDYGENGTRANQPNLWNLETRILIKITYNLIKIPV